MTYPTTVQKIWLADIADDRCTIGSGDQEIARDIPLDIGRLIAAAPALLAALCEVLPHVGVGYSGIQRHGILEKARAAIRQATELPADQTVD